MFKQKTSVIGLGLLLLVGLVGIVAVQAQSGEKPLYDDPWLQKPVLPYLLLAQDDRLEGEARTLFAVLRLSEEQGKALREIAIEEQRQVQTLYQETQPIIQDKAMSLAEKQEAIQHSRYDDRVVATMINTDQAVRQLLGGRYPAFRDWIRSWWPREQEAFANLKQSKEDSGILSDASSCQVYATQYFGYTDYEVALPDKYVKWANLGWGPRPPAYNNPPYTINIRRGDHWVWTVLVREVGPWNIDDNYWDTADGFNPRRIFTDIPLCHSEAEYAYMYNYNGGKDQFGRTVTLPNSIDLTPNVADDLGLGYMQNAWVRVYYYDLP